MPQIYLIDLTCTSCGQTNTQAVTDSHTETKRVRIDTQCTCGAVHWYTLDAEDNTAVMVFNDDLIEIPF